MGWLNRLLGRNPLSPSTILEGEGLGRIYDPDEKQVRDFVLSLTTAGPSFGSLTDASGNYVQVAGSRPWCVVERRQIKPLVHERAYQDTPNPKYTDGAKLRTGAGEIELRSDEWFLLKDAAEVFVAFLHATPLPAAVQWRPMNETLRI